MSDIACIYQMNMLEENNRMEQDILSGRGLDILFSLMDKCETVREIAKKLEMPVYSVQLYIQRMVKSGLIIENQETIQNGQIERSYSLIADEIEIVNNLKNCAISDIERKRRIDIAAQHFSLMTKNAIKCSNLNIDKPSKIKSYFIKTKKENMEKFTKEIDILFKKYQILEDLDGTETYSLFTILAPYEVEN